MATKSQARAGAQVHGGGCTLRVTVADVVEAVKRGLGPMGAPVLYHVGRAYGSYLYSRAAARSTNFLRSLWDEEGWGALTVSVEPLVVEV